MRDTAYISSGEEALLLLDAGEKVSAATPRALALMGSSLSVLKGRHWADIKRPADISATIRIVDFQHGKRHTKLRFVALAQVAVSGEHARLLESWADSSEMAILRGPDGRLLSVNSSFARKFGASAEKWLGRDPSELIHPDDLESWKRDLARLQRSPHQCPHEHRWMTAQGWRWLSWEEQCLHNESGSIIASRAIGRDVTRRRLAEEHFEKLATIVEQTQLSVVLTTPDGRVEYVNPRFTQTSGYTLEEIFEQRIEVLRTGFTNDADYRAFLDTLRSGKTWRGEFQTISKRGEARWESAQVSPINDHRDRVMHILCLREDITDRKMLEAQLRQAQKMEVIGTLAGGISHDFNNLLAIIAGFCEMAIGRAAQDEKLTRYLREIHGSTQRATALVRQILSFSRSSDDGVRQLNLNQIVEDMSRLLRETFPRDIAFDIIVAKALPPVLGDANQLQQVIMNLCVNARDAMPRGGVLTLKTSVESGGEISQLGADAHGQYVCVEIGDTGCGMPADVKERIFEPFFTTKGKDKGTGLGLAVVLGIVSKMGGVIDVQSVQGKGTRFLVYLPVLTTEGPAGTVLAAASSGLIPPGTETIMVVEDEPSVRILLQATLEGSGYKVLAMCDGAEALEFLAGSGERVDLIVLDLNMPRVGGLQVREYLRRTRPDTKLVIASGHVPPELRADIEQAGDAVIVGKPFSLATLGTVIRQQLDHATAPV